jgi:hypothetical protein
MKLRFGAGGFTYIGWESVKRHGRTAERDASERIGLPREMAIRRCVHRCRLNEGASKGNEGYGSQKTRCDYRNADRGAASRTRPERSYTFGDQPWPRRADPWRRLGCILPHLMEPPALAAIVFRGISGITAMADHWRHAARADAVEDDAGYVAGWTISGLATLGTILAVWVFAI